MTEAAQSAPSADFRHLAVRTLVLSPLLAQAERRKHFDQGALGELAASITEKGIVQPIVVRPTGPYELHSNQNQWYVWRNDAKGKGNRVSDYFESRDLAEAERRRLLSESGTFEVVAGERRVLAAEKAGLTHVPAIVRVLDDEQALDVQLIENLQREGLHELVECQGYEDLKKRGHTIEQIAEKVGKSASYVYKRLELAACGPAVRDAFFEGTIDASRALLLSRLKPEATQKKALKEITEGWNGPMSYRRAVEYIRGEYMLRLDQAPFKTEDAELVKGAGPCGACPKNTAMQAGLFGDVSKQALCTDSKCFQSKVAAATAITIAAARANGQDVLEGKAAKNALSYDSGFVKLSDHCYEDNKNRTYAQLLGKHAEPAVAIDDAGRAIEVISKTKLQKILKDKGIKLRSSSSSSGSGSSANYEAQKKAKAETKFRQTLYEAVRPKLAKKLGASELRLVAATMVGELGDDGRKEMCRLWIPDYSGEAWTGMRAVEKKIATLSEVDLVRLILDCCYVPSLRAHSYSDHKPEALLEAAKRTRVDAEKIRRESAAKPANGKTPTAKK